MGRAGRDLWLRRRLRARWSRTAPGSPCSFALPWAARFQLWRQDARSAAALPRSHRDSLVAAHSQMVSGSEILAGFALLDLPFPTYGTQTTSGCAPQSRTEQIQRTLQRIQLFLSANETAGCPSLQVTPLWKKMSFASLEKCTAT